MRFTSETIRRAMQPDAPTPAAPETRPPQFDEAERDRRLVSLYLRGYTTRQIAAMRGIYMTRTQIRNRLPALGVETRPRGFAPRNILTASQFARVLAYTDGKLPTFEQLRPLYGGSERPPRSEWVNAKQPTAGAARAPIKATPTPEQSSPTRARHVIKRRRPYKLTPEQQQAIVDEYREKGTSGYTLAHQYGVNSRTIYAVLRRYNVPRRAQGNKTEAGMAAQRQKRAAQFIPSMTAERNVALLKARLEERLTYRQLADRFKISEQRVSQILSTAGAVDRTHNTRTRKPKAKGRTETMIDHGPSEAVVDDSKLDRALGMLGVMQSAIVAVANDLGIIINPDGTIDRMERPNLTALFGSVPDLTGELDSVEYVRRQRDDDELPDPADAEPEQHSNTQPWEGLGFTDDGRRMYGTRERYTLPPGWRYMTDTEKLEAWAGRGGTPPANLVVRDDGQAGRVEGDGAVSYSSRGV